MSALERQIELGRIKPDIVQSDVANRLDRLYETLVDYDYDNDNDNDNNNQQQSTTTIIKRRISSKIIAKAREDLVVKTNNEYFHGGGDLFSYFRPASWNRNQNVSTISRRHPKHRTSMMASNSNSSSTTTNEFFNDDALLAMPMMMTMTMEIQKAFNFANRYLRRTALRFLHTPIRGIYIHGSVGIGKSFLMDLFHEQITTNTSTSTNTTINSRRVHFHEFMLDVHQRIHEFKKENPLRDALPHVAHQIISSSSWG